MVWNHLTFCVQLNSLLSQTSSLGIFKLIDACTLSYFLIQKSRARLCADGEQSCLASPASGITFAHCFIHCEHFAGKKGETVTLLKWSSDTISTNYKFCLKWCNTLMVVFGFVVSSVRELWASHTWSYSCCSVAQSCPTLCDPMVCSTPGLPVLHHLPELAQTRVHWIGYTIQPSHPLLPPSAPALNLSQHQGLFQWVSASHQVARVLELQLGTLTSVSQRMVWNCMSEMQILGPSWNLSANISESRTCSLHFKQIPPLFINLRQYWDPLEDFAKVILVTIIENGFKSR